MVKGIYSIHQEIRDFLINEHKADNNLIFVPRKTNRFARLDKGYWFIGNDRYLQVSFWNGMDWKEKIHNISFVVMADGESFIELSAQDSSEKAEFLRKLGDRLGDFERLGKKHKKNKWNRAYTGTDYLANLQSFIKNEKPVIDQFIRDQKPKDISIPDKAFYDRYVEKIVVAKERSQQSGNAQKIARISWNTAGWKQPSGPYGKSRDTNTYEAKYGYGHEEWLFDRSRIIDGYHYAYLQPLSTKSGKHIGEVYDIYLYAINGDKKRFYVGNIKNVQCITKEDANKAYELYKRNGWIKEMSDEIKMIGADPKTFQKHFPEFLFNMKFKFNDATILDELEEIDPNDRSITSSRFKLLPRKVDFTIKIDSDEDEPIGKKRGETVRKVFFKKEVEYDPYHNKMQNVLEEVLTSSLYKQEYKKVRVESGRVDVKALTHTGVWHFFEVKTDPPKLCLRNAIGQLMEYAYWPDSERAEKLIVIGSTQPDEKAKRYLQYVRQKFKMSIFYRCLDMEKKVLSADY